MKVFTLSTAVLNPSLDDFNWSTVSTASPPPTGKRSTMKYLPSIWGRLGFLSALSLVIGCGDGNPKNPPDMDDTADSEMSGTESDSGSHDTTTVYAGDTREPFSPLDTDSIVDFDTGTDTLAIDTDAEKPIISLYHPLPMAVYQRNQEDLALVPIEGEVVSDTDIANVVSRYVLMKDEAVSGEWADISYMAPHFVGTLEVPSGGWYRIEVRALDDLGLLVDSVSVEKVGVGEVFIPAGQSNAADEQNEERERIERLQ